MANPKKWISFVLLAALCGCLLTGCGEETASSAAPVSSAAAQEETPQVSLPEAQDASLTVSLGAEPASLDPAKSVSADTDAYSAALFEGLYKRDADGNVVFGQAESATVSEDRLVWTFTLREDACWSDGKPVTAEDFVYAWRRNCLLEDAGERELFAYLKNGEALLNGTMQGAENLGVRAVDDRTLEVALAAPCDFLDTLLLRPVFSPLRSDVVEGNDGWDRGSFVSNGPMTLAAWSHKESITLQRSETYYAKDEVTTQSLTCQLSEGDDARLSNYDASGLSYCTPLPADDANMRRRGDLLLQDQDAVACLEFYTADGPLADARVRKALSLAIDRDTLAAEGTAFRFPAAWSLVPEGFSDAVPGSDFRQTAGALLPDEDYAADVAQANALLDAAGYEDRARLSLTIVNEPGSFAQVASDAIVQMWQQALGISCTVRTMQPDDYQAACAAGDVQVTFTVLRATYGDASALLEAMAPHSGQNRLSYDDAGYTALLSQARTATDAQARYTALHEAEAYLLEVLPVTPLFEVPHTALLAAVVTGAQVSPAGVVSLAYFETGSL